MTEKTYLKSQARRLQTYLKKHPDKEQELLPKLAAIRKRIAAIHADTPHV